MSLEALLNDNIKALEANTAAIKRHNEILEGLGKKGSADKSDAKADTKSDTKDEKSEKSETKGTRGRASGKGEKAPSPTAMKDLADKYLDVQDEDEYQHRRKVLRAIVDHFGAEKFTTIETEDRLMAFKLVEFASKNPDEFRHDDIPEMIEVLNGGGETENRSSRSGRRRSDDDV